LDVGQPLDAGQPQSEDVGEPLSCTPQNDLDIHDLATSVEIDRTIIVPLPRHHCFDIRSTQED
jgi:hypothetical protein